MGAHMDVNNLIQGQRTAAAALSHLPQLGKPESMPAQQAEGLKDSIGADAAQRASDQFSAMMYHSKVTRVSVSAQFQQARARAGEDGGLAVGAQQLQFDFFAESRTEQVAAFNQRTQEVASGRPAGQRETFLGASRMVAQRFQMSVSVSGQSLQAFAGAAEALDQSPGEMFDAFMTMADEVASKTDELFNEAMEMLDAFVKGADDFKEQFNEFLATLQEMGFLKMSGPLGPRMNALPEGFRQGQESAGASPRGQGAPASIQMTGVQMEFKFSFESVKITTEGGVVQESDPITLDLDGDGIELTHHAAGARFDIEGVGRQVNTAFVTGGDAFLAIDANGNGAIDSGRELFGDQNGARNGFEELRRYDSNGDGRINAADDRFGDLLLFRDNGNGQTEEGELLSLTEAGIQEIGLGYRDIHEITSGGNRLAQDSYFTRSDGSRGRAADAILNFTA